MDPEESVAVRAEGLAGQVAASMGYEVVLVEIKRGAGRSVVRAYIDRPGGVTLDDCERFSKRLSVVLDVEDAVPFSYVLEVSSPGLDRPLFKESDYRRFLGKAAKVRTRDPVEGSRHFKGKIAGIGDGRLRLEVAPEKEVEIALGNVVKANLVIEL